MKWSEKYPPKTIDEYVFSSKSDEAKVKGWIKTQFMGHSLFYGYPGTGKTTLANMLPGFLGIDDFDILKLNASEDFSKTYVKTSMTTFMHGNGSSGGRRVVIIDEADELSKASQKMLMGIITYYGKLGVTFYIACNSIAKLDQAMLSRCAGCILCTNTPDRVAMLGRVIDVLDEEKISFTADQLVDLETLIDYCYPRLRDTLDELEQCCSTGVLIL